jgi:S1-C subfamily serine protease
MELLPTPSPADLYPAPAGATPTAGLAGVAVPSASPAPFAAESSGLDPEEMRRIAIYRQAAPAVVNITTQIMASNFFWGVTPEQGSGSGWLWDSQGDIVTNYHVVSGAQQIEVSFGGSQTMPAKVVGTDPINDLAVVKVSSVPAGARPLVPGVSANLQVGQTAIAIGNPFGQFERTLTVGVISALDRTIQTENTVLRGVIQTDAAINEGNSGGPLLDSSGRVIGVNSAIYSPSGTSAGVGLAIPIDKVRAVVPVLLKGQRYPHPWLGVEQLGYELTPELSQALDLTVQHGLLVAQIYQDSPAERAGLQAGQQETIIGNRRYITGGDIISAIDGHELTSWDDLTAYLEEHTQVGQKVTLTVVRNGRETELEATLADMPDSLQSSQE